MSLQPLRADIAPYYDKLVGPYRDYCVTVSRRGMAISIETAAYLWWLCDTTQPAKVCDLGSGFTSYVLRRACADVVSVDDSRHWLKATAGFLAKESQPTSGLLSPDEWLALDQRYDLIVHDFSAGGVREEWMWHAADRGAIVVFDDAQNASHHAVMAAVAHATGRDLLDVWHQTVDEIGRYAAVLR